MGTVWNSSQKLAARILIAQGSAACGKLLEGALADQPYALQVATNNQETLKIFEANRPDILIVDWMMPGLSSLELCREVRKRPGTYTYIVLTASKAQAEDIIEGLAAGADDYLTKPFDVRELLARIRVG
jgi:DNA-binding response OmpR family regulator